MEAGPAIEPTEYPTESSTWISDCACSDPACPRIARHVFVWPESPVSLNAWNVTHHRVRAQHRAAWREAFRLMAQGCAPLAWSSIVVDQLTATRRLWDAGNCLPSVKAAIDGVVSAGVLPDDGPAYVRSLHFNAPVYGEGRCGLIITLDGPCA